MDIDPLGIFLATLCTGGEKLLFRYPNEIEENYNKPNIVLSHPYALKMSLVPQYSVCKETELTNIRNGIVVGFEDPLIANLLVSSKSNVPRKRYEVKVGDVLFVGCPNEVSRNPRADRRHPGEKVTFNVTFALRANIDSHFIPLYQDLAEKISLAIVHEEGRTGFMSKQKQTMMDMHELPIPQTLPTEETISMNKASQARAHDRTSIECPLGIFLRNVYESICEFGNVDLFLNNWVRVSFSISPKVPRLLCISNGNCGSSSNGGSTSFRRRPLLFPRPSILQDYLREMRPYHSFILLEERGTILDRLTVDCSPLLVRLLRACTPLKSIDQLAAELDAALTQVRRVVCSLVMWGFAMLIYPIYDSNIYLLSPEADLSIFSPCATSFSSQFPCLSYPRVLEGFSSPLPFSRHRETLRSTREHQGQDTRVLVWLLQHRLVYQLHTYPHVDPFASPRRDGPTDRRVVEGHTAVRRSSSSRLLDSAEDVTAFNSKQEDTQSIQKREEELFLSLAQNYFNGRYHLEAIMYRESISRTHLCYILDRFRDCLYIIKHEEPFISYWVNPDL